MNFDMSNVVERRDWPRATLQFSEEFCQDSSAPKYILGRNIYAESVARSLPVTGFIDDFTDDVHYLGLPIVKTASVPKNALVLNASGGRPLSARARLNSEGLRNLDYFAFSKVSGLSLMPMRFNEGFQEEFLSNRSKYEWAYQLLNDSESRSVFEKLVRFRFDYDISHLEGFRQRGDVQYFEDFLALKPEGETFVDVGCYDGYTSLEFIRRCPNFYAVHAFEPDSNNFQKCTEALRDYANTQCYPMGLSNAKGTLRFDVSGSASRISETGSVSINVDRLDDVLNDEPTLIKMDIEGGEAAAIEGAKKIITASHPRLAISAYHAAGDFWSIPQQVHAIRDDYDVYMRHYTECIYETVLFFMPRSS